MVFLAARSRTVGLGRGSAESGSFPPRTWALGARLPETPISEGCYGAGTGSKRKPREHGCSLSWLPALHCRVVRSGVSETPANAGELVSRPQSPGVAIDARLGARWAICHRRDQRPRVRLEVPDPTAGRGNLEGNRDNAAALLITGSFIRPRTASRRTSPTRND